MRLDAESICLEWYSSPTAEKAHATIEPNHLHRHIFKPAHRHSTDNQSQVTYRYRAVSQLDSHSFFSHHRIRLLLWLTVLRCSNVDASAEHMPPVNLPGPFSAKKQPIGVSRTSASLGCRCQPIQKWRWQFRYRILTLKRTCSFRESRFCYWLGLLLPTPTLNIHVLNFI